MSAAEERLGNDPTSELWGEHRARYRFALQWVDGQRVLDVVTAGHRHLDPLDRAALAVAAEHHGVEAAAEVYAADGSSVGFGATLTAVAGLHF